MWKSHSGPKSGCLIGKIGAALSHTFVLHLTPAESGASRKCWSRISESVLLFCVVISMKVNFLVMLICHLMFACHLVLMSHLVLSQPEYQSLKVVHLSIG